MVMHMRIFGLGVALTGLFGATVYADTFYMKNGVVIHGKVELEKEGQLHLSVDGRPVILDVSEISNSEQNDQDGSYPIEAARAKVAEEEKKLTELTGLTTEQRQKVDALLEQLNAADGRKRDEAHKALVEMAKTVDVFGYLSFLVPSTLPVFLPQVIAVMFDITPDKMGDRLREFSVNPSEEVRAVCLELLGKLGDRSSLDLIARGLLDHELPVQIAAGKALEAIPCKEATPLLLKALNASDLRLQSVCLRALSVAWSTPEAKVSFEKPSEWADYWNSQAASVPGAFNEASMTPLVEAGTYFQNE